MPELGRTFAQGGKQAALGGQGLAKIRSTHHIGDAKAEFIDHGGELVSDEPVGPT